MKKWKILSILSYFVPIILYLLIRLFTKWGHDVENCIFAFFVGVLMQFLIGVLGLIAIRKYSMMIRERILFLISLFPLVFVILLFIINRTY